VSVGHQIDQAAADRIEAGKTTKEGVIRYIGSPDQIITRSTGDTMFMYSYVRASAKPATFIPLVGPFVGGSNVQHQSYIITFGSDGIVKEVTKTQGGTDSGVGAAARPKQNMPEVEENKRP
jgi:outer membrane protein assembly factor BamE (lipoprotein component of BamABCDE complex)